MLRCPFGLDATEADFWVQNATATRCVLLNVSHRAPEHAGPRAYDDGRYREDGGDGRRFCNVLIPLSHILK
jgi:hypothetical protein